MSLSRSAFLPLSIIFALMVAVPGVAVGQARQSDDDQADNPRELAHERRSDRRALSAAVRRITRSTDGQVLSAERVPFDGRDVNRIKVVDGKGRVRVYWDDPQAQFPAPAAANDRARRRAPARRQPAAQERNAPPTRRDDSNRANL